MTLSPELGLPTYKTLADFDAERLKQQIERLKAEKEGLMRKIESLLNKEEQFSLREWMLSFWDLAPWAYLTGSLVILLCVVISSDDAMATDSLCHVCLQPYSIPHYQNVSLYKSGTTGEVEQLEETLTAEVE